MLCSVQSEPPDQQSPISEFESTISEFETPMSVFEITKSRGLFLSLVTLSKSLLRMDHYFYQGGYLFLKKIVPKL